MTILFFTSLLVTFLSTYFLIPKLRVHLLDKPNYRSLHSKTKITGGGISFVLSSSILTYFIDNNLFIVCLPLALIGFFDDLYKLGTKLRYFSQVLTSLMIIYQCQFILDYLDNFNKLTYFSILIFLIIFITAIINFINFMDGMDGLVASCLFLVFSFAALRIDLTLIIISGGLLGFVFWNWEPSKIFMGDTGSTFLGAILAGSFLKANDFVSFLDLLICSSPLLMDALVCILRRFIAKENVFSPHTLHLYQRLYKAGWSHCRVSTQYFLATLVLILSCLSNNLALKITCICIVYAYAFYLDQKCAKSFLFSISKSSKN